MVYLSILVGLLFVAVFWLLIDSSVNNSRAECDIERLSNRLEEICLRSSRASHNHTHRLDYFDNIEKIKELAKLLKAYKFKYDVENHSDDSVLLYPKVVFYDEDGCIINTIGLYEIESRLNDYKSICCNKRKK